MSDAVQATRSPASDTASAIASTAAAAEIAVRAAAGAIGVQTAARMVRDYPLLTLLLATGVGFVLGGGWRARHQADPPAG